MSRPPGSFYSSTALDAGIIAVQEKTGLCYSTKPCPTSQSCLTNAHVFGNDDPAAGLNAAYVEVNAGGALPCYGYVYYTAGYGWSERLPTVCPKEPGINPVLGGQVRINAGALCAHVYKQPSLGAQVVTCLADGTLVTVDATPLPRWDNGNIWWSIDQGHGWVTHGFLFAPAAFSQ